MNINEIAALKQLWALPENIALAAALSQEPAAFEPCAAEIVATFMCSDTEEERAACAEILRKLAPTVDLKPCKFMNWGDRVFDGEVSERMESYWGLFSAVLPSRAAFAEAVLRFCGLGLNYVLKYTLGEQIGRQLLIQRWRWEMLLQSDRASYQNRQFIPKNPSSNQPHKLVLDLHYVGTGAEEQLSLICELEELELLALNRLKINSLPADIAKLRNLISLHIGCIEHFPALSQPLPKLQELFIVGEDEPIHSLPSTAQADLSIFAQVERFMFMQVSSSWLNFYLPALPSAKGIILRNLYLEDFPLSEQCRLSLERLHLSKIHSKTLPQSLAPLPNLQKMVINLPKIKRFPRNLAQLSNLQTLYVRECLHLSELPPFISKLPKLQLLSFYDSKIAQLPDWLPKLKALKELYLSANNLDKLPEWLPKLGNLERIDLSSNNFKRFPKLLWLLPKLKYANLSNNFLGSTEGLLPLPQQLEELSLKRTFLTEEIREEFSRILQLSPPKQGQQLDF